MTDKQFEKLAPCPWGCKLDENEVAIMKEDYPVMAGPGLGIFPPQIHSRFSVCCSCGAQGPHGNTQEEAIERWNRRV